MEKVEEVQAETKQLKTPRVKIDKALARYHAKKTELLKDIHLKGIAENGRLPTQATIDKHELEWKAIAEALDVYIKEHPAVDVDHRARILDEKRVIRDYTKILKDKRNQGDRSDDLNVLNRIYVDAHECQMCKTMFLGKKKVMNCDKTTGLLRFVFCETCSKEV